MAQPRRTITSPIWSGLDDEEITYSACYINVHELIPWRTLTGRQELYQDHLWMRAFGEALCVYKPPVDTKAVMPVERRLDDGRPYVVLNFLTPAPEMGNPLHVFGQPHHAHPFARRSDSLDQ